MHFEPSAKSQEYLKKVKTFIAEHIQPIEKAYWEEIHTTQTGSNWQQWKAPEILADLKARARDQGLWNMFLPDTQLGCGLSNLDYAPIAEATGHSLLAPTVFNCNAPDTGNMEVLHRYGNTQQKQQWLMPLLEGTIRSVFCMTEPDVASSDATNMEATAVVSGDEVILNGKKWWASGLGDPEAKIGIFMARTPDPDKDRHHQHTMVLVPLDAEGVDIKRMLPVFGEYDAPHGHGEVHFNSVRVPASSIIGGPGLGFAIAQGRLGPGRIHHCMRCIGAAEEALSLLIQRGIKRTAFHRPIIKLGGNCERVAEARLAIDQARLLTHYAAWKIDTKGIEHAVSDVSAIKVVAPNVLQDVVDFAIQIFGGAGVCRDTALPAFFYQARSLRIADGPDEVHKALIARHELKRHGFRRV